VRIYVSDLPVSHLDVYMCVLVRACAQEREIE